MYKSCLALLALLTSANAICNPGEIGVGSSQLCSIGNPTGGGSCGAVTAEIFSDSCDALDTSEDSDFCTASYTDGSTVACDDDHNVTGATVGRTEYGSCRAVSGTEADCSVAAYGYYFASFCCVPA
ncbi:uncharacterized protein LTR77_003973 [Saxophila tyrrhenica]|uniref:Uncharacterized protein n=1 Tax=Saxophila tyrrhenica TaxID=1690608 RepID=A0AAV9PF33_9PEZI|nr:hypothetical protein LTR77_003973 [Saxophila tyrrhenica]